MRPQQVLYAVDARLVILTSSVFISSSRSDVCIWNHSKSMAKRGICPLKPDIFTDADFAPSASTSMLGHFPASYHDDTDLEAVTEEEGEDDDAEDSSLDDGSESECELLVRQR